MFPASSANICITVHPHDREMDHYRPHFTDEKKKKNQTLGLSLMQSYTTYSLGEAGYDFTPPHSKNLSALGASSQHPHVFICLPPRLCFPDCLLCLQRGGQVGS